MAASKPDTGTASDRTRTPVEHNRPLIVWRFTDGKPGHDNQTQGLLAALRTHAPVDDFPIQIADCRAGLVACLTGRTASGLEAPDPDLIIGAGHATHLPMLNARRVRGGRVVVLMKPTLPTAWFDLCVIPAHDRTRHRENILVTHGVLNRVRHDVAKDGARRADPGRRPVRARDMVPARRWPGRSMPRRRARPTCTGRWPPRAVRRRISWHSSTRTGRN